MNARNILLAAAAAMPILSAEAGAQNAPARDHYLGASFGALLVQPEGVGGTDATREASARGSLGLFAGTRLGSLPVGAGWPVFAEIGFQEIARHTVPYRTGSGTSDLTASGQSVYGAVKVDFWTPGNFALYGKLGVAHTSIKASTRPGQAAIQAGGEAVGAIWALGAQYDFAGGIGLRVEWIGLEDASPRSSARGLSAGLAYRF